MLEAYLSKQKTIARHSAQTELYVDALQTSHGKAMTSLMRDVGYVMDPTVGIGAKATEHILHRLSVGRMEHIDVATLGAAG